MVYICIQYIHSYMCVLCVHVHRLYSIYGIDKLDVNEAQPLRPGKTMIRVDSHAILVRCTRC